MRIRCDADGLHAGELVQVLRRHAGGLHLLCVLGRDALGAEADELLYVGRAHAERSDLPGVVRRNSEGARGCLES